MQLRRALLPALLLSLLAAPARALLPEAPPDGLRLELSLECDFSDHFWDLRVFYDRLYPADLRFRLPARVFERTRSATRDLSFEGRLALYRTVRDLIEAYTLGTDLPVEPSEADVRRDERTLNISLLTVRSGIGRVDELQLAIDLTELRQAPAGLAELEAALIAVDRRLSVALACVAG